LTVKATEADVSDQASISDAVAATVSAWGRLDILVSNAAITDDTPFESISAERWHQVMNVNLDSVLYGAQAAMPHLRRSPCASIVNVASIQGLRGQPNSMAYATAKGAVVNLTRCMAVDFGPLGVRVNAIAPGAIRTPLQDRLVAEGKFDRAPIVARTPLGRMGEVADIVSPAIFLASDEAAFIVGVTLVVDGGWLAYGL